MDACPHHHQRPAHLVRRCDAAVTSVQFGRKP
jgi:hypothetical protein